MRTAYDYTGDPYPGETDQIAVDRPPEHDWNPAEDYKFFYGNGQFHISEDHDHDELASHAGIPPNHAGPMAVGHVHVDMGKATFEVMSNIGAQAIARILKDYCKQVGWSWGGLTDHQGEPVGTGSEFAPTKSYYYDLHEGQIRIARRAGSIQPEGAIHIEGDTAVVYGEWFPGLQEWADDQGYKLAGNDNVLKRIEDLEENNTYSPEWNDEDDHFMFQDAPDERLPGGVFKCQHCGRIFHNWKVYMQHRNEAEPPGDYGPDGTKDTQWLDMDAPIPAHWHDQPSFTEAKVFQSAPGSLEGKDMLPGPVPFIYDIDEDAIHVGNPGARHSDIPGKFTPGGIVEGTYEPGGKVAIRSMTNMPYTVRHMLELWYYQHPHMEITNVHLVDDADKRTKLAGQDIGGYIMAMTAADPTAWRASRALRAAGGRALVVGGAVRDALRGKEPKDIDLMVTGLAPEEVRRVLGQLPGKVDLTGKDFGVFRYKEGGGEVEIALPRRERSTGPGHKDQLTEADHTMTPQEDLFRRDFTVNAMAVDLDTGHLIDPFGGAQDVKDGRLRTLNTRSLSDDPLRTVRALVAASKHGFHPDDATKAQMGENAAGIQHLPGERIKEEVDKLLLGDNPGQAIRLAHDTGVLKYLMPNVDRAFGWSQDNPHHELELGEHLVNVLDRAKERKPNDPDFLLAALNHDTGKFKSRWDECKNCPRTDPYEPVVIPNPGMPCPTCGQKGSGHFYKHVDAQGNQWGDNHEDVGAKELEEWMRNMRYSEDRIKRATHIVQHHMFPAFDNERGARKFLNRVGDEHADDLIRLRWADQGGKSEYPTDASLSTDTQQTLVNGAREAQAPTQLSQLAINGRDLIAAGMKPGPDMGTTLERLVQQVVENPELNTKEGLLGLVRGWGLIA